MTNEHMVEQIIEAMHGPPDAPRVLVAEMLRAHPNLPAARLPEAFKASAEAIETMFAQEGKPPHQATRARLLATALEQDIGDMGHEGSADFATLAAYWATGYGAFPALWPEI